MSIRLSALFELIRLTELRASIAEIFQKEQEEVESLQKTWLAVSHLLSEVYQNVVDIRQYK